jgi:hypothetical protein
VAAESGHHGAPEALRVWIARPPQWLTILPDPAEFLDETLVLVRRPVSQCAYRSGAFS